jgi:hypothetical protein
MLSHSMIVLPRETWQADRERYLARIRPWIDDRRQRQSRHEKHPVYDFLFEYYEFRAGQLERWTPGVDVLLASATRADVGWPDFQESGSGLSLPGWAFPQHRIQYLRWAIEYLETTRAREPVFGCMGLHEWAMVYREPDVRHSSVPLRLPRIEIDAVVEEQGVRCTHFDAYRFFTHTAQPLNRWELTRAATTDHDQPGCLHVNMDLYRFAYKIAPYCPSELVAGAFEVARMAREIDMRASPYDLNRFRFSPIAIETSDGRAEYAELQRGVHRAGQPVRERLIELYRRLLAANHATCFASTDGATEK